MNIAQRFIDYYETEDFESNYAFVLDEIFSDEERDIKQRITEIISLEYSDFDGHALVLTEEQEEEIYQYIKDNIDEFIERYCHAYVGSSSLASVSFGEQEEQLTGLYNHNTGKEYSLKYLQKTFESEGYYVDDDLAYYNLGYEGLHVDLFKSEIPLLEELIENYKKEIEQ